MLLYTRRKNSSDSQSAFCTHSAVCSLYFVPSLHFVSGLQSAFCTNRYPWHQYSLFFVTVIRATHTIYHNRDVVECFHTSLVLLPLPACFTTEQSTVKASLCNGWVCLQLSRAFVFNTVGSGMDRPRDL